MLRSAAMNMSGRALLIILAGIASFGCSALKPLGIKPGTLGHIDPTAHSELPGALNASGEQRARGEVVTGLIVVGRVWEFEPISQEDVESVYEQQYLTFVATWQAEREPSLSLGQFTNTIGGFTKIRIWQVSLLLVEVQRVAYALVPSRLIGEYQFPVTFWTRSGDLIAAKTNDDGVLIVRRILCMLGPEFGECSSSYVKGAFDATTGRELDNHLESKKDGSTIDTNNFQVVDPTSNRNIE